MATVINNPGTPSESSSSVGLIIGIIFLVIVVLLLFFRFGFGGGGSGTQRLLENTPALLSRCCNNTAPSLRTTITPAP